VRAIIVGCGRVGAELAKRLLSEGHHVTVVDLNQAAFDRLGSDFPGDMVHGNALDEEVLSRAGIESADALCTVTPGDNRNLMIAQMAKEIFKVARVITRIYDPIREQVYHELGLETYCSTTIGTGIIYDFFATGVNRAHSEPAGTRATA
jgi:trk system potassium uptake protein TrkA